jgi:hypothetical protein
MDGIGSPPPDERFRLRDVDLNHPAIQFTMPLVSVNDDAVRCIGTAFSIAPGLAVTAAHVVYDWLSYQEDRDGYKRADSVVHAKAIQLMPAGFLEWVVEKMYCSAAKDIAFLQFARPAWWGSGPNQTIPSCARLNFNPPRVGDRVKVFGFPESKMSRDGILEISPCECDARVCDVHLKEESAFRPLSYIDIVGEILGGMSGGPCFDLNWNVLGVNSKGWKFQENGPPLSYVALMWPAMNMEIDLFKTGCFPVIDLFNQGPGRALGYQKVFVTSNRTVHLGKHNVEQLTRRPPAGNPEYLLGALEFAIAGAQAALAEIRAVDQSITSEPLDVNAIHSGLHRYFWELDAALNISVNLCRQRLGLDLSIAASWDDLLTAWRQLAQGPVILDKLGFLNLEWYSRDLSELRTFAGECRSGLLVMRTLVGAGVRFVSIGPCIVAGEMTALPDGLTRFYESCGYFVRRVLFLSRPEEPEKTDA